MSRRMTRARHVACIRDMIHTKCELQKVSGKDHPEDLGVDGKIILK
jgi:hypothetical protein